MTCVGGSERRICFPWKQQIHNSDKRSHVDCRAFHAASFDVFCFILNK